MLWIGDLSWFQCLCSLNLIRSQGRQSSVWDEAIREADALPMGISGSALGIQNPGIVGAQAASARRLGRLGGRLISTELWSSLQVTLAAFSSAYWRGQLEPIKDQALSEVVLHVLHQTHGRPAGMPGSHLTSKGLSKGRSIRKYHGSTHL